MQMSRNGFLKRIGSLAVAGAAAPIFMPRLSRAGQAPGVPARATRVTGVELLPFTIPKKVPQRNALGVTAGSDGVFVRLRTADGVTGLGESAPYAPVMGETLASDLAVGRSLADIVKGRDAFAIPQVLEAMEAFAPHNPGIKAAYEMALWDICGKVAGQPVYRLLGAYRDSFETDLTVHLETPQEMARLAAEVVAQGFPCVKVKLGEAPVLDIERIRAIRAAIGPVIRLRVDANQAWSPANAVLALAGLEPFGIEFCEQPVPYWDWAGMKFVRGKARIPIMADEAINGPADAITGIRMEAMDMINIKLMKSGGILRGARIATIAEAANLQCMVGCMNETRVALTAAAHLVLSQKSIRFADLDAFVQAAVDPIVGGMTVQKGIVRVPDTPGLGVDVDPVFLKQQASR
jgi:L-alanine-DL-glutamate epimerase-like enolase superfamily enzyme